VVSPFSDVIVGAAITRRSRVLGSDVMSHDVLDRRACDRARLARDARFDGRFFTGVLTTRIYCRPTCPVKPAQSRNVVFFATAAAAERAGFRPCLRCRPEAAPGTPAWRGVAASVSRALRLIERGFLDDGRSVDDLADTLGMTARHLRRLFLRHAGASPTAVAGTRRVQRAKTLIDETTLPMSAIAFAAGFTSIRRFNAAFRAVYRRPPSALRRRRARRQSPADTVAARQMRRASLSMLSATTAAPARKVHASVNAAP
jgi:AraC family transcriptional regulator, regulatory protein of adaptative response / methylated-DNA-[protein]-cysteine methyltransferase